MSNRHYITNQDLAARIELLASYPGTPETLPLYEEIQELRRRLLSAAGDDLCRLSPEEIKAYSGGTVKIPPKEDFLASCERFHSQIATERGVLKNCLTLAQLIVENAMLREEIARLQRSSR